MILGSYLWKLELGLWTYDLIRLLGPSVPNVVYRPQAARTRSFLEFHDFIGLILILERIRSCLWKLELRFWTYDLLCLLGPSCPKLVFTPQTPNVTALESRNIFMSSFIKVCMKQAISFKFWVIFDKVMSSYSQKIANKPTNTFFLVSFQIGKFSLSLVYKNPFWSTKIPISPQLLGQILKISPF